MAITPFFLGSVAFWMASQPPENVPPPKKYTPVQVKKARERVETFEAEAKKTSQAAEQGKRQPFKFVLTEDDLNAYINQDPELGQKLQERGFKDLRVSLGEGTVGFQGSMPAMGRHIWVKVDGPVRAGERGKINFLPGNVEFGRMKWAMPESMRKQMLDQIKQETQNSVFRVPGDIKELTVSGGKLVVRGTSNPDIAREIKEEEQRKGRSGASVP